MLGQTYSRPPLAPLGAPAATCTCATGRHATGPRPRPPRSHRLNLPSDVVARMGRPPLHWSPRKLAPRPRRPRPGIRTIPPLEERGPLRTSRRCDRTSARLSAASVSRPVCRPEPRAGPCIHQPTQTAAGYGPQSVSRRWLNHSTVKRADDPMAQAAKVRAPSPSFFASGRRSQVQPTP